MTQVGDRGNGSGPEDGTSGELSAEELLHYRMMAEYTSDIVLRVRLDGVIEWVSPGIVEVLGFTPGEWVGRPNAELIRSDHREQFAAEARLVAESGADARFEFPVQRADGSSVWMESVGRLVHDSPDGVPYRVVRLRDISAQHAAQRALADSEALFRLAMANAPIGMCLIDPDGSFVAVNAALCDLLGRDEATLTSSTWQEMTHPEDLAADLSLVDDVTAGRRDSYRLRKRYLRPDGTVVWGDLAVSAVRHTDGRLRFFISQIVNVSDQVNAERAAEEAMAQTLLAGQALGEQHRYLRALLDLELESRVLCSPVRDTAGRIVDFTYEEANPRALEYFGRSADEILGARMLTLFPGQATSGLFDKYLLCLTDGQPLVEDDLRVVSDVTGQERWIDLRALRVGDALAINWRDTTDSHLASRALRQSEERFRLLADSTSDIIVLADATGLITWTSPALTTHLGWQPDDWIGHRPDEFTHPADMRGLQDRRAQLAQGERLSARLRFRDKAGSYHWVESRAAPFRHPDGTSRGVMATITIIDELVAKEEELRHKATHDDLTGLLTRDEAYQRLKAMLAHDVRTGTRTFLAFIDVDDLKRVNDESGHAAGDELLRIVSERVRTGLRQEDLVARIGGDELLLILPGMQGPETAVTVMRAMLERVNSPHPLDTGTTLHPRISIGLAEVAPSDTIEAAVHRADSAMYEAKADGGNQVRLGPPPPPQPTGTR